MAGAPAAPAAPAPLSFGQIERLWVAHGGSAAYAPTMAGIAEYESGGGNPSAQYPSQPVPVNDTNATGLWQVMPSNFPAQSVAQLANPNVNASDAVLLAGGKGSTNAGAVKWNWQGDPVEVAMAQKGAPLTVPEVQAVLSQYNLPTTGHLTSAQLASSSSTGSSSSSSSSGAGGIFKWLPGGIIFGKGGKPVNPAGGLGSGSALLGKALGVSGISGIVKSAGVVLLGIALVIVGLVVMFHDGPAVVEAPAKAGEEAAGAVA